MEITLPYIPNEVLRVTETLEKAGFEAYLVGGCVRDLLLGRAPKDWDITTNAVPSEIQSLFEETYYNNDFGTVGVVTTSERASLKVIEITPYRTEGTYTDARRPDSVSFSKKLSDDLERRDFSINAMAFRVSSETLVDMFNGKEDLKKGLIRAVGDANKRFSEDALRILRAVRLSAELGFVIEADTLSAIVTCVTQLEKISKERIRDEFSRIMLSDRPAEALFLMKQVKMLQFVIPDIMRSINVEQNKSHKYNVFEHLVRSAQHAADKNLPLDMRLAALFHDISKPESRRFSQETHDYTFYGHEVIGARVTKRALQSLKYPNELVERVSLLVRWHMFFSDPDEITLSAVRRMISNVGKDNIWDLLELRICDRIGSGRPKEQPFRFRKYKAMVEEALRDPVSVGMLKVDGAKIMETFHEKPGPKIGWTLHALLEEVIEDPTKNTEILLLKRAKELLELPDQELEVLGRKGKEKRDEVDDAEIAQIQKKYGVQ